MTQASDGLIAEMEAGLEGVTPGNWETFICDDGGMWSGWPLSINCPTITDKTVVRPGGFYPYNWDAKTSQHEACQNALHIARCSPDNIAALIARIRQQAERIKALEAGLKPFADFAKIYDKNIEDEIQIVGADTASGERLSLTVENLRTARALLTKEPT